MTVAARTMWSEDQDAARAGFARLFAAEGFAINAQDPAECVLFPEMDETAEVPEITTNLGHPGYANAAIDEVYGKGLIPMMFAQVATGKMSAEEASAQAEQEAKAIFEKWREAGKV